MSQTVIGIFDSAQDAQYAVERLQSTGISRERVDIAHKPDKASDRYEDDDKSFGDGISNFFSSLFGNDDDAKNYSEVARRGYTVTVHASTTDEAERAAEILDNSGAVDVDERANQYRSGYSSDLGQNNNTYTGANPSAFSDDDTYRRTNDIADRSIPVIEENLEVSKREIEHGGARLNSRIVERPVEEHIRLRHEHIHVERNAVNRPATEADFDTFREGTVELTERREIPVVNKEAHVVEEVSLNKEIEETEETIRDKVRKTEVDVEKFDNDEYKSKRTSTGYDNDGADRDLL